MFLYYLFPTFIFCFLALLILLLVLLLYLHAAAYLGITTTCYVLQHIMYYNMWCTTTCKAFIKEIDCLQQTLCYNNVRIWDYFIWRYCMRVFHISRYCNLKIRYQEYKLSQIINVPEEKRFNTFITEQKKFT